MFQKTLTTCLLAVCVSCLFGQRNVIDSLAVSLAEAEDDSTKWYYALQLSGQLYRTNLDSSLLFAEKSLEYAQKTNNPYCIANCYSNLGAIHKAKGDPEAGMKYLIQAIEIAEKEQLKKLLANALNNVATIHTERSEGARAIPYLRRSFKIAAETKDTIAMARALINTSDAWISENNLDSALFFLKQGRELLDKKPEELFGRSFLLMKLGEIYKLRNELQPARKAFEEGIILKKEIEDLYGQAAALQLIAEIDEKEQNYAAAVAHLRQALPLSKEAGSPEQIADVLLRLSLALEKTDDFRQAYQYLKEYQVYRDSFDNEERERNFAEMETQFRTREKEVQLANQQLELERQSNLKNSILIGAIALLLALIGIFQYFRNKQKIRQKETELKAHLRQVEADKLREMDVLKSTFFANISHEFRTPLTLIISPLEQMLAGTFKGDFKKYYGLMHRNGVRLLQLVNQLLDLSRLESGKMKLEASESDLTSFIKAVAYSFESLAARKQIDYTVSAPEAAFQTFFDKDKLEKILSNLLSNAFKFTPENGEVFFKAAISELPESGNSDLRKLTITVRDSGLGIPESYLPHLFERFSKEAASELQNGSGIGLALTKELVELHGGEISVKSKEGAGATFTVSVQIGKAFFKTEELTDTVEPEKIAQKPPIVLQQEKPETFRAAGFTGKSLDGAVILLVEDNADVRVYVKDQLRENYQIIEAENGKKGFEKAVEVIPDLIISDIMMPEMDGLEFCKQLKINEKTSHIPIIMLTAKAGQTEKLEGLSTGADDYLVKPFDAEELNVRVANLIAQRKTLQTRYRQAFNVFAPANVDEESTDALFLKKVKEVINANIEDELFGVVELSGEIGMSRSQLHRKLKALTNFAPNEIIRNMRLEKARALLERKAGNASEIAYMTGFNSPAYFAKCFKDYFGMSPSEV